MSRTTSTNPTVKGDGRWGLVTETAVLLGLQVRPLVPIPSVEMFSYIPTSVGRSGYECRRGVGDRYSAR